MRCCWQQALLLCVLGKEKGKACTRLTVRIYQLSYLFIHQFTHLFDSLFIYHYFIMEIIFVSK